MEPHERLRLPIGWILLVALALARPASAATPLDWVAASPDVTVTLGFNAQDTADEDVVFDGLAGLVGLASLGSIPAEADVAGYDLLANGDQLLCFDTTVVLAGPLTLEPGDVVRRAGSTYSLEFDASANGVPAGTACDALAHDGSGLLLLSFDVSVSLPGGVMADDEDLVRLDAPSAWTLAFDASAAGVPSELDVDGAHLLPGGNVALSFDGSGSVGGVDFDDEDVVEYDPGTTTWSLAYDGSAADPDLVAADVNAIALPEPSLLLLFGSGASGLLLLRRLRIRS